MHAAKHLRPAGRSRRRTIDVGHTNETATDVGAAAGLGASAAPLASAPRAALSIEELYVRYSGMVLRRARRFYAAHEAEEVVHEVFVRVMERGDSFRGAASPSTWLYRITTNLCLNRLRDSGRRRQLLAENHEQLPGVGTQRPTQESHAVLRDLWRTLPEELAQIGIYYHLDGLTHDDIAALVGTSAATVRNRLKQIVAHGRSGEDRP